MNTSQNFVANFQKETILWLPVCIPTHEVPSEKGLLLKDVDLFQKGDKTIMKELPPLKVYIFPLTHLYSLH